MFKKSVFVANDSLFDSGLHVYSVILILTWSDVMIKMQVHVCAIFAA